MTSLHKGDIVIIIHTQKKQNISYVGSTLWFNHPFFKIFPASYLTILYMYLLKCCNSSFPVFCTCESRATLILACFSSETRMYCRKAVQLLIDWLYLNSIAQKFKGGGGGGGVILPFDTGTGVMVEWGPLQMGTQGPYNLGTPSLQFGDPVPIIWGPNPYNLGTPSL